MAIAPIRFENTAVGRRIFLVLHLAGFLAHSSGIIFAAFVAGNINATIPLYAVRISTGAEGRVDAHVVHAGELYVVWLVFAWFGCSLLFHLTVLVSWAMGSVDWYFCGLERNVGWWRWLEYTFSASIMLLAATAMLGTREVRVVVSSTLFIAVTMAFGYATELVSTHRIDRRVSHASFRLFWRNFSLDDRWALGSLRERMMFHVFGYVPFVAAWWLAFDSLYSANSAWVDSGVMPANATDSLWAGFALFTAFGFVQLALQLLPFGPSVYWLGEVAYCVLSVVAKFTMAMLMLFIGLTPDALAAARAVEVCLLSRGDDGASVCS